MKSMFILSAIACISSLSADQYGRGSCSSGYCSAGGSGYDSAQDGRQYYQGSQYQGNGDRQYYQDYARPQGSDDRQYYQDSSHGQYQGSAVRQDYQARDNSNPQYQQNYQNRGSQSDSDLAISRKVDETLKSGWFSKGFEHVTYNVSGGVVTLRGSVGSVDDKNKVQDKIRKIDGVTQVNNQIEVSAEDMRLRDHASKPKAASASSQPDYAETEADRALNQRIRDQLSSGWDSSGYEALILTTRNGVVIINGTVDTVSDAQKVEAQLKGIDGVREVRNNLTLSH